MLAEGEVFGVFDIQRLVQLGVAFHIFIPHPFCPEAVHRAVEGVVLAAVAVEVICHLSQCSVLRTVLDAADILLRHKAMEHHIVVAHGRHEQVLGHDDAVLVGLAERYAPRLHGLVIAVVEGFEADIGMHVLALSHGLYLKLPSRQHSVLEDDRHGLPRGAEVCEVGAVDVADVIVDLRTAVYLALRELRSVCADLQDSVHATHTHGVYLRSIESGLDRGAARGIVGVVVGMSHTLEAVAVIAG